MKRAVVQRKQTKPASRTDRQGTVQMREEFFAGRSSAAPDERTLSIFQPDILAADQYLQHTRRKHPLEPEKKLMMAILQDAVDCFQKYFFSDHAKGEKIVQDAEEWVMEKNSEWLFSFESVCESLGLNADYIRNGLMEWKRHALSIRGRKARIYHLSHHRRRKQAKKLPRSESSRHLMFTANKERNSFNDAQT
jgi:hypothetical protein